jgi:hypothetical protein
LSIEDSAPRKRRKIVAAGIVPWRYAKPRHWPRRASFPDWLLPALVFRHRGCRKESLPLRVARRRYCFCPRRTITQPWQWPSASKVAEGSYLAVLSARRSWRVWRVR